MYKYMNKELINERRSERPNERFSGVTCGNANHNTRALPLYPLTICLCRIIIFQYLTWYLKRLRCVTTLSLVLLGPVGDQEPKLGPAEGQEPIKGPI